MVIRRGAYPPSGDDIPNKLEIEVMNLLKRIYRLLIPEERKAGGKVIVVVFFTALLDFVGLAALLPVLYYLLEGGESQRAAMYFCLLAVGIVLFKSVLIVGFTRYQNRYLLSLYKRLSFSLFSSYYRRGLLFIREQGSNRLGYEVNYMCFAFSQSMLAPLLRMGGDGLLIVLVTVALLVYDWQTVLILYASFLPMMGLYVWGVRKRVRKYGEQEQQAKRKQAKVVSDTFRGFQELEVNGAFSTQQASFLEGMDDVTRSRVKLDTIMRIPLFLSELSVILGLTILVVFGTGDVKVLVGIFAVAAFRLLPALRTLLSGWTQIQNVLCCLDVIEEGLKDFNEGGTAECSKEIAFEKEIRTCGLTYVYPGGEEVLENLDVCIRKGEYVGFRGYSGVGKSTLFNLLLGFLKPTGGQIYIDQTELTPEVRVLWLQKVGYVPQDVFIFQGTLAENIALGCKEVNRERILQLLEQVSLGKWLQTLDKGIDTVLGEAGGRLSGGQKQRIGIARALYKDIEVLLLDEATSALDNHTEKEVNETLCHLKQMYEQLTILSIAHRESSLTYCDRVITLEKE